MPEYADVSAIEAQAIALDAAAVNHKRAAAFHRRRAQQAREKLAELLDNARRVGIHIEVGRRNRGGIHGPEKEST